MSSVADFHLNADDPHSDDRIRQAALSFAEAVRDLNHATRTSGAITDPATINAALGDLRTGLQRMDQLLKHLRHRLVDHLASGRLADTSGMPGRTVEEAEFALVDARETASHLAADLDRAFNATSSLCLRDQDGE